MTGPRYSEEKLPECSGESDFHSLGVWALIDRDVDCALLWTEVRVVVVVRKHLRPCLGASPDDSGSEALRQLSLFETWPRDSRLAALAVPDCRWTYDQDYMIAFIEAIRSQHVPMAEPDVSIANETSGYARSPALIYCAGPILSLDIGFAVTFAAFIVCAAFLAAEWLADWPWLARVWVISACMGVVYGVADVAEDITLRRIFNHAEKMAASKYASESLQLDTALADAAQVDAANALNPGKTLRSPRVYDRGHRVRNIYRAR